LSVATILIVDDLAANRKGLVTLLRAQKHRLLEAPDGHEALAAARAEHPDLVITDVLMPVMDGYALVRQLRLDPATCGIPVVFSTAPYGEREARAFALSSGVSGVLTKPADPREVLKVVGRVLCGEPETEPPSGAQALTVPFDREHLRLLTDELSEETGDLRIANARLRALINVGLEIASDRDAGRLLQRVCVAARELFGATYVTLGILDRDGWTVRSLITCGADGTSGIAAAGWLETGDAVCGILGTVVTERRSVRGDNPGGDPANLQLPLLHPEVRAFVAAPIASPTHVYGWICLVGNEGRTFTEDDEHLVVALSAQVGRIHENLYLTAAARKRSDELEREVREREEAESALRQERDRAQRYLDAAEVILLALDTAGRITLVNRYARALLGWPAHELLGRDWFERCLPASERDAGRTVFHRVVDGDLSLIEGTVLTRSGEERRIEWRNTQLRDDAGLVIGTFSSGTDITEQHQAVEALRTAEERMRFALEAAGAGIWDMDFTTGVLRWSDILESHYGLEPGTFGGTFEAFVECVHPDDREALRETLAEASRSGTDFSVQHRALRPDGTVRWLNGAGRVRLGEHGEPVRAVGVIRDITARHTLEAQYQQAQKMEAVGQLAGGMAHDFNNLLTVILGYCDLSLADLDPADPHQADILQIREAGERAAVLTRQLLAYSRTQVTEPAVLDLNAVVADTREMLGRLIGEDVKVVLSLSPGLAPVKADRVQLEQIVMNLAVNARDAMPGGGTLAIETANVDLDEQYATTHLCVVPGAYVALTVTDSGTGMTPQVQARLCEPFFTTKAPGKGTGLGLATVHDVVMQSGGSINFYSETGKGTSVKVYFPRADTGETVVEGPPLVAPSPAGIETVLVVDDEAGLLKLATRLLQRQGYTVLIAGSAEEALRVVERNPSVAVVLTDVVMPGVSGPELTRQVVERRPALKVIYMSGYPEGAIARHGILDPGIAFLPKPFTADTLGRKIREVLDA
jgi:PAS domain S-box-containing protein